MSKLFVILLVALSVATSGCAAGGLKMSKQEIAWHSLNVVDGYQTITRCDNLYEANPLMGKNPSDAKVAAYIVGFSALYHWGRKWIEENEPGGLKAFDIATFGVKLLVVGNNISQKNQYCD